MRSIAVAALTLIALSGPTFAADLPSSPAASTSERASGEDIPTKITPEQRAFGERMIAAINKKNIDELKALTAPKALACFDQSRQAFLKSWLNKHFRYSIPAQHTLSVSKLSRVPVDSRFRTYPVVPTYVLEIQFQKDGNEIALNRMIGQQDGKWYESAPCPTQLGMDRFNKVTPAVENTEARVKEAYARVDESLAERIRGYLAKHDQANALKLCAETLHVDIGTARQVVAMLAAKKAE